MKNVTSDNESERISKRMKKQRTSKIGVKEERKGREGDRGGGTNDGSGRKRRVRQNP